MKMKKESHRVRTAEGGEKEKLVLKTNLIRIERKRCCATANSKDGGPRHQQDAQWLHT